MTPTEKDALNREICEKLGICWHEWDTPTLQGQMFTCELCGEWSEKPYHPDFAADPGKIQLLREMVKREDFPLFMARLMYMGDSVEGIDWDHNIDIDYILDTTGLLALAARDFMRKEKP